jgi:hypothetical protein
MKNKGYNGHKNRAHWNVSLWLSNDEVLYGLVIERLAHGRSSVHNQTKREIAEDILHCLQHSGTTHTPDGYLYNVTNIRAAIVGM